LRVQGLGFRAQYAGFKAIQEFGIQGSQCIIDLFMIETTELFSLFSLF